MQPATRRLVFALVLFPALASAARSQCASFLPDPGDGVVVEDLIGANVRVSLDSLDAQIYLTTSGDLGSCGLKNNAHPWVANDGSRVAWATRASYVDSSIDNDAGKFQVYLRDADGGLSTVMCSHTGGVGAAPEDFGGGFADWAMVSGDGAWVVFVSSAGDLTSDDFAEGAGYTDVFLYEVASGVLSRVSRNPLTGDGGNEASAGQAWVSCDGRYVAYASKADNLPTKGYGGAEPDTWILQPTGGGKTQRVRCANVFVLDRGDDLSDDSDDQVEWISLGRKPGSQFGGGTWKEPNGCSDRPSMSADGRWVAYESDATNLEPYALVGASLPTVRQIYVHDRRNGTSLMVSRALDGEPADGACARATVSADGRFVCFESDATNLVSDDTNGKRDVFVHDRTTKTTSRVSLESDGTEIDRPSVVARISGNGRFVVYTRFLDPGNGDNLYETYLHDRDADDDGAFDEVGFGERLTKLISESDGGGQADRWSGGNPGITSDGRWVVFMTEASDVVASDTNCVCASGLYCKEGRDIIRHEVYE